MQYYYKEKSIKNIDEVDTLIAVSGTIVNKSGDSFVLDDGYIISVYSENMQFKIGDYVRVFGKAMVFDKGIEIHSDFIQDLSKIDKQLHRKIIMLLE